MLAGVALGGLVDPVGHDQAHPVHPAQNPPASRAGTLCHHHRSHCGSDRRCAAVTRPGQPALALWGDPALYRRVALWLPGRGGHDHARKRTSLRWSAPGSRPRAGPADERPVLLDTSVIIDGRIADISQTGFISGTMLVPRFVLNELQHIADSPDALRRNRGRRGLDMLNRLKEESVVPVRITDMDVPEAREVDDKLIMLAKNLRCPIVTNDYNLNRVAQLQGVVVLNINELANAVKSVLLPGETIYGQDHPGGQGAGAGCRLPGRWHDDRRRRRAALHRPDHSRPGQKGPAENRGPAGLCPARAVGSG